MTTTVAALDWNPVLADMPFDRPVLVHPKASHPDNLNDVFVATFEGQVMPFMGVRLPFENLDAWVEVLLPSVS